MGLPTGTSNAPDIRRVVREEIAAALKTQVESLQAMTGERGTAAMRAVRRGDVARIGSITLNSAHAAGAAPTAAEHNALVDDVKALAAVLERIAGAFSG